MKAIFHERYGSPDVLHLRDVDRPAVKDDEVLVRVRAAGVNPYDWHSIRGLPYLLRIGNGLLRPAIGIPGVDVAGHVESVGKNVTRLKAGDEVFGLCKGAFAEFACGAESRLSPKPANLTFEQAAAVPVAGLTALQALRDRGRLQAGQKVLIVGASGGVGSFAVQIARAFGAGVTGVCSTKNLDLVRALGAEDVIDYTQADFTRGGRRYDLMVDMAGTRSLSACRRALTRQGACIVVGAPSGRWLRGPDRFARALVYSWFVSQRLMPMVAAARSQDLDLLKQLIEAGKVTPVVDRIYKLEEAAAAIRQVEEGHTRGKIVLTVRASGDGPDARL